MKNTRVKKVGLALTLWVSLTAGNAALAFEQGLQSQGRAPQSRNQNPQFESQGIQSQNRDFWTQSFDQSLGLFLERDAEQSLSPAQKRQLRHHLGQRILSALQGPQSNAGTQQAQQGQQPKPVGQKQASVDRG